MDVCEDYGGLWDIKFNPAIIVGSNYFFGNFGEKLYRTNSNATQCYCLLSVLSRLSVVCRCYYGPCCMIYANEGTLW